LADIGGWPRFANRRLYFEAAISPNEVRFRKNGASSSPQIRFCSGSAAGICLIIGQKTQIRGSLVRATGEELHMTRDTHSRERDMVVQVARAALTRTIEQYSPPGTDVMAIAAVAVAGMFADLISGLSSNPELADVVNRQIEQSGYRLVGTRRH
jgi:hypothetical protein